MKIKIWFKRFFTIATATIIVFSVILYAQDNYYIYNDDNSFRTKNFYREEKNSLDVVFLGASEIPSGFFPGLAYQEFGFTSYPFASDGQSVRVWKSQLIEILKYQTPKLIVVEIGGALYDEKDLLKDYSFRSYIDNMPLSVNKIETLTNSKTQDDFLSYCFPVIKYHGDLNNTKGANIQKRFFDRLGYSRLKGIVTLTKTDGNTPCIQYSGKIELHPYAEEKLREFLAYCQDNQIENIIFTRFPFKHYRENTDWLGRKNEAKDMIVDAGFRFLDFTNSFDEIGLDNQENFYNQLHMNVYGAEKFTYFFGKIISDILPSVKSTLSEEQKVRWDETVQYTNAFVALAKKQIASGKEEWLRDTKECVERLQP